MSAQVTILQLPAAGAITGTESVPIVQNGVTVKTTTGAIAGSPSQPYTYLTVTQTPQLANSRYVGATNGLTITDGGAQGLFNISTTGAVLSLVNSATGFQVKTDSITLASRSIAVSGAGLSIANGSGVSGNPTISLDGQVLALANLSANGLMTITTGGGLGATSILGTASQIAVTNGNGVSGSPTIGIASNPTLPGLAGVLLPAGSSADRSVAPVNGILRYNTDFGVLEAYINGAWSTLASGSGVTSVATGTGLTGGPITSTGTISIANTAVTAGSYTAANITVNAQGQITAASSNASLVSSFSGGSTGLTPATATTGAITLAGVLVPANGGTGAATLTGYVYGNGTGTMTASTTIPTTALSGTVTNAQLANSTITLGTTTISLGSTSLAPAGLTSVTVTQDPTTALQLATKQYVDTQASTGLVYHQPVQAATTAALTGVVVYNNGAAGVGATLTLTTPLTVLDGYTLLNTNRVLIKDQANQIQNGIYTWATGGTVLTRATDADTYGSGVNQLSLNDYFFTQNGTVNKGIAYVLSSPSGTITFGTSNLVFAEFSTSQVYSGTSPINISGTVISLTTVPANLGGTGQSSYTAGDILYASGSTTLSKLTLGTNGYVLTAGASAPAYVAQSTLSVGTATNIAGGATGSVPYNSAAGTTTFLALGTNGYVLTAGASAPAYVAQSTLSVGSATNTDTTASSAAATHYLVFKSATTGSLPELVNSAISVYPSTGAITGGISGGTF
jgi:hypothetical protein